MSTLISCSYIRRYPRRIAARRLGVLALTGELFSGIMILTPQRALLACVLLHSIMSDERHGRSQTLGLKSLRDSPDQMM